MFEEWIESEEVAHMLHLYMVLDTAQRKPFTVKSTFARAQAQWVAFCASEGFLSIKESENFWGDKWNVTATGQQFLGDLKDDLDKYTKSKH